jgi:hypothetical protein
MEQAAAKYRAAPDTVFHASHALLLKILTNIVSEPDGKTACSTVACKR